jgi:hypothetical protein
MRLLKRWRNPGRGQSFDGRAIQGVPVMKGILLWALGIPIPVIVGLYLFHVI